MFEKQVSNGDIYVIPYCTIIAWRWPATQREPIPITLPMDPTIRIDQITWSIDNVLEWKVYISKQIN